MSLKIKVSYESENEANLVLNLLKPILPLFKVKKSTGTPPYKNLFFMPKNTGNSQK